MQQKFKFNMAVVPHTTTCGKREINRNQNTESFRSLELCATNIGVELRVDHMDVSIPISNDG